MQQLLGKSLSSTDLMRIMRNQCKIYTYNELSRIKSLDQLFGPYNCVFILYETRKNYGHWCVLTRDHNRITFFDSYGIFPDMELKWTPQAFRRRNNMILPHLTSLLYHDKSGREIHYNNHRLQRMNKKIATCGRWCAVFALMHSFCPVELFADHFLHYTNNPDKHITDLTYFI